MPVAELVRNELRGWAAAVAFLTRVPLGRGLALEGPDLARGVVAFPVVGAAVGAASGGAGALLAGPLPDASAGVLALTVAVLLTGALHLDGLADTADAIGGRSREAALAIMRDPRVGSYGVSAVVLLLLLEATALAALVSAAQVAEVAAAFALARSVAPAIAGVMPYAREGHGLARALTSRARAPVAVGVACAVVLAVRPRDGLELVGCAALCAVGAAAFCRSRFGGVTGDTLGGTIAVTEVGCLLVACIR